MWPYQHIPANHPVDIRVRYKYRPALKTWHLVLFRTSGHWGWRGSYRFAHLTRLNSSFAWQASHQGLPLSACYTIKSLSSCSGHVPWSYPQTANENFLTIVESRLVDKIFVESKNIIWKTLKMPGTKIRGACISCGHKLIIPFNWRTQKWRIRDWPIHIASALKWEV